MLLIFDRAQSHVPLKILSIEDGSVLKAFNHLLHRNKKVDFIEQFNEKLLVKQENENLQILDVSFTHGSGSVHERWESDRCVARSFSSKALSYGTVRCGVLYGSVNCVLTASVGCLAGAELSADGGEQDGIHDTFGIHIPVRESAVPDIPQQDCSGVEL
jgi:hypothetical protein